MQSNGKGSDFQRSNLPVLPAALGKGQELPVCMKKNQSPSTSHTQPILCRSARARNQLSGEIPTEQKVHPIQWLVQGCPLFSYSFCWATLKHVKGGGVLTCMQLLGRGVWRGGDASSAGMGAMRADGYRQSWASVVIFGGNHRITWRNNTRTLGPVSSVQVPWVTPLVPPPRKALAAGRLERPWGPFLGKTATRKRKEEEHLKMRQHEWNILLHLNRRSSTAVGRQKVFMLPLHSPLHHPPSLRGNDFGGRTGHSLLQNPEITMKVFMKPSGITVSMWRVQDSTARVGQ